MRKVGLIIGGLLLIGIGAWGGVQATAKKATFIDAPYGYTLDIPQPSSAGTGPIMARAVFFQPAEDKFAGNISVAILNQSATRKEFAESNEKDIKSNGATLISSTAGTISGHDAQFIEWQSEQNGQKMHNLFVGIITPNKIYMLTYVNLDKNYKRYEAEVRASMKSFRLTGDK
jgi:hypothetical protein